MTKILLTRGVTEYRRTINLLSKYCKKVVGIDKGESYCTAIKTYPNLELYKIDGFNIREVLNLGYKFNKIYIDISGCRSIMDIIKIVQMYENAFKPEVIVVKSTKLKRFARKCRTL